MPLGDVPFGSDPLGVAAEPYSPEDKPTTPRAPFFDGTTRDFTLDDDGRYVDIHPTDAAVQFALFVEYGKAVSALDTGHTLRSLPSPIAPAVILDITDRVRRALKSLLDRRLIRLVRVEHHAPNRHTLFVAVTYVNVQTAREEVLLVPTT